MGNLVVCETAKASSTNKIENFEKDYSDYCVIEEVVSKANKKGGGNVLLNENKLLEHIKIFHKNRLELEKTNEKLYKMFFIDSKNKKDDKDDKTPKKLTVSDISQDDEENFYYFFNKRNCQEVTLTQSYIVFPKFAFHCYPSYRVEQSYLTKIVINNSTRFVFQEMYDHYLRMKNLTHLDLGFNNIDAVPIHFRKMVSLRSLSLRRNKIKSLPELKELRFLTEIDLSENDITKFPEAFNNIQSLEKINLNLNHLETISYSMKNNTLKYLYLAGNYFKEIFPDILNFTNLKHVALDGNQISEIKDSMFKDIPHDKKYFIGISNNLLKQGNSYGDIFEVPITQIRNTGGSPNQEIVEKEKTEEKKQLEEKKKEESKTPDGEKTANQPKASQDLIKFKDVKHWIERKINSELEEEFKKFIKEKKVLDVSKLEEDFLQKRKTLLENKVNKMIEDGQISEIGKFGSLELKIEIKQIYANMKKTKSGKGSKSSETETPSGQTPNPTNTPDPNNPTANPNANPNEAKDKKKAEVIPSFSTNEEKDKDGLSNLKFLTNLHGLMTESLPRIFLYKLRNFDKTLFFSLRGLILDENDSDDLVLILSEMKLFLIELINYYQKHSVKGNPEIEYDVKILTETNVIYKIFKNRYTLKMLYTMGLADILHQEHKSMGETKDIEVLKFIIDNFSHSKQKLFENFLTRFMSLLKTHKIDYVSLLTD